MTFTDILKGLNDGGFAFVGMLLVAAIMFGSARLANWLINVGFPKFLSTMEKSAADAREAAIAYQAAADKAIAQSEKVVERGDAMQDRLMAHMGSLADGVSQSHNTIISKLDTMIDKIGGRQ